jgi:hypothetical protein
MHSKNLLPKFGSGKNPFSASAPESEPVPTTPTSATNQVARYQMSTAELAAARLKETKRLPLAAPVAVQAPSESKLVVVEKVLGLVKQWAQGWKPLVQRLKSLVRLPQRKVQGRAAALVVQSRTEPVQAELSLDRVKVVRNDLSDADVEIIPAKLVAKSKPKPERSTPAESEVELIKT